MKNKSNSSFHPSGQQVGSLFAQALNLHQSGQLAQARTTYEQVLKIKPSHPDALQLMGTLALQEGRFEDSIEWIQRSLKLSGRSPNALNNLGLAYKNLGRLEESLKAFDQAIAIQRGFSDAMFNRANVLIELDRLRDALAAYDQLLASYPGDPELHFRRGRLLVALDESAQALASLSKAVALAPNHLEALTARGILLAGSKHLQEARQDFEASIRLAPHLPSAHSNLGNVLSDMGLSSDALICYHKAIQIDPKFMDAQFNIGVVHQSLQQIDAAISAYRKAIEIDPMHVLAQWNLGLCLLMAGQMSEGWKQYEWRWKNAALDVFNERRNFDTPQWDGSQNLAGKTVLLYSEQGLGDSIQFCRFAHRIADLGANVILELQSPLIRLLSNVEGVAQVIERGDTLPQFDFHCPLMSLPLAFDTGLDTIPTNIPYLQVDDNLKVKWNTRLGETSDLRVGVAWSGRSSHADDHNRSAELKDVLTLLTPGVQLISLQNEIRSSDLEAITGRLEIQHFGSELTNMAETAALCDQMDIIVSVDTSIAHLAGALGKPLFVMLPFVPDWRWLLNRDDSPWYPTARLFRQSHKGKWSNVLTAVRLALEQALTAKRRLQP